MDSAVAPPVVSSVPPFVSSELPPLFEQATADEDSIKSARISARLRFMYFLLKNFFVFFEQGIFYLLSKSLPDI